MKKAKGGKYDTLKKYYFCAVLTSFSTLQRMGKCREEGFGQSIMPLSTTQSRPLCGSRVASVPPYLTLDDRLSSQLGG